MAVQEGDFIRLNYTGRVDENVFDTTDETVAREEGIHKPGSEYGPVTIRVGSRHVIVGLDDALVGRDVGDEGDAEVPPEKGFGPHDDRLVRSVPITRFRERPKVGMRVEVEDREGTVINVIGRRAVVDFNHPLAGKTLHYHFVIEGMVEEPEEQIRGLIRLYTGRSDIDVNVTDSGVELLLPPAIAYDCRWLVWRGTLIREIFEYMKNVGEITMKEIFKRPETAESVAESAQESEESGA